MADQMLKMVNETEKREGQIEKMQMEFQLELKLLEHQVRNIAKVVSYKTLIFRLRKLR